MIFAMRRFGFVFMLLICLAAPAARAEVNVQATLSELRSDDYATRQRATQALLADEKLVDEDFKALCAAATLPEQRERLLDAARHHLVRRMQEPLSRQGGAGSLGLSLLPAPPSPGAPRGATRVGTTYPGFPAYVSLRPGDLILAVNGQVLPVLPDDVAVRQRFVDMIQVNPAGTTIRLKVSRDGKPLDLSVKLASFDALNTLYESEGRLRQSFHIQWDQLRRELTALTPTAPPLKINLETPKPAPAEAATHLNEPPAVTVEEE
jgi:hypothetical protein